MKLDFVKIGASLILILALLMCSSVATETTWRHSGFELWGYDINFTDHNASNIHLLHADYLHGDCSNVTNLNASNISIGEIPLAQIPNTLTGKDADTLDGYHAASLLGTCNISTGSYTGDDSTNRAILHNLSVSPKAVNIIEISGTVAGVGMILDGHVRGVHNTAEIYYTPTTWDATNFYIGDATHDWFNVLNKDYYWVAFS